MKFQLRNGQFLSSFIGVEHGFRVTSVTSSLWLSTYCKRGVPVRLMSLGPPLVNSSSCHVGFPPRRLPTKLLSPPGIASSPYRWQYWYRRSPATSMVHGFLPRTRLTAFHLGLIEQNPRCSISNAASLERRSQQRTTASRPAVKMQLRSALNDFKQVTPS